MAKSNYPNKLDTSIEIPAVRDNIVEIGSDVINSIRSSIFQIEKTLGVNPQGSAGNSVASRLNKSLDPNGNILKEALDSSGLLTGPISDSDVSSTAAIKESKLKLNFPTNLLQSEISQISSELSDIITSLNEISIRLSSHLNSSATNRHNGGNIYIEDISNNESATAIDSFQAGSLQKALGDIFSSHINYDGANTNSSNRSHDSNQIFFDNNNVSSYISSQNMQDALEEIVTGLDDTNSKHQRAFHSNGYENISQLYSSQDSNAGTVLVPDSQIQFSSYSLGSDSEITTVTFVTPPANPGLDILKSDLLKITNNNEVQYYQIYDVNYSLDGQTILSVEIFGRLLQSSSVGAVGSILRQVSRETNSAGLLLSAREYGAASGNFFTNTDIIQLSSPNASSVISIGCRPKEISLSNRYLNISSDGEADIEYDLYDPTFAASERGHTLDSIIRRLNYQFADNRTSLMAYRLDFPEKNSSEIAIVHCIQNDSEAEHTIKISRGSDSAIDSLGLSSYEDQIISQDIGSQYYIKGVPYTGLKEVLNTKGLFLIGGTSEILFQDISPSQLGIRVGHIISIFNSDSDDGSYVVSGIRSQSILVDRNQLPSNAWSGTSSEDTQFVIYEDSLSLNGMAFKASVTLASLNSIIEIFLDSNRDLKYNERLSYEKVSYLGEENIIAPVLFGGSIQLYDDSSPGIISVNKYSLDPADTEIILSLDGGHPVRVKSLKSEKITLKSGLYDTEVTVFIPDSDTLNNKIVSDGSGFDISIYGFPGVNPNDNLLLGLALYSAGTSRLIGADQGYPRLFGSLRGGLLGEKDLGSDTISKLSQVPHAETRSNGVVYGLEVTEQIDNGDTYTVSLSPGVCYIKGKRFSIPRIDSYITNIATGTPTPAVDKFYIAINENGEIIFSPADLISCSCTLSPDNHVILAAIENDLSTIRYIDLRLFITDLDNKLLNSITVSPQPGMGHFSHIGKAIKYAKRFSEVFPLAGVPSVHLKSGKHTVVLDIDQSASGLTSDQIRDLTIQAASDAGLYINFPINIFGEGDSTELQIIRRFTDVNEVTHPPESSNDAIANLYLAGANLSSTPSGNADIISNGFVNISNLKIKLSSIDLIDHTILDQSGDKANYGTKIENVIFDFSKKTTYSRANSGVILRKLDSTSGDSVGNISVKNSQFLNSHILTEFDSDDHANLEISGNSFRGTGDGVIDGEDHYAIWHDDSSSILGISEDKNINFYANILTDNDGGVVAEIDNLSTPWTDRISRSLSVFGSLGVGVSPPENNLHVDGSGYLSFTEEPTTSSNTDGSLIIGDRTGLHIAAGETSIIGRNSNSASKLYLNKSGEEAVSIGLNVPSVNDVTLEVGGSAELTGSVQIDEDLKVGTSALNYAEIKSNIQTDITLSSFGSNEFDDDPIVFIKGTNPSATSNYIEVEDNGGNTIFSVRRAPIFGHQIRMSGTVFIGVAGNASSVSYYEGTANNYFTSLGGGVFNFNEAIVKPVGSFKIRHPDPSKHNDYWLFHSFVESPTAGDNIYRWSQFFDVGKTKLELPDYYKYLNKDTMVWVSPVEHFGRGWGRQEDNNANEITICVEEPGIYNILVIGTRKDRNASEAWKGTERLITEEEKQSYSNLKENK